MVQGVGGWAGGTFLVTGEQEGKLQSFVDSGTLEHFTEQVLDVNLKVSTHAR